MTMSDRGVCALPRAHNLSRWNWSLKKDVEKVEIKSVTSVTAKY